MLNYLTYLKLRYLNEKGQGVVEYAAIVAVVVVIAVALGNGTFKNAVINMYSNLTTSVGNIK